MPIIRTGLFAFVMLIVVAGPVIAQESDVTVQVSNRETYIGVPVTLTITIHNTDRYVLPDAIEIEGVRILSSPGRSEQRSQHMDLVSGKTVTTSKYMHEYRIIPSTHGVITVPALSFIIDGQTIRTEPIDIIVKEIGVEEGDADLLILEIESERETYFLGEPAEVTLRIWIRPYHDLRYNVTVTRDDMWRLVNEELSTWGEFTDLINRLNNSPFRGLRNDTAPVIRSVA